MTRLELIERLTQTASDPTRFVICAALGNCYLARTPEGRVALLAACSTNSSSMARTSGALLITCRSRVTFAVDDRSWLSPAVVIECLDDGLVPTFIALALDVSAQLEGPSPPSPERVFRSIAGWERLLRSRSILSEERELGLWGELLFILQAPSIDGAIRSWTTETRGVIDFSGGGIGVEVKTSASRLRHAVSHQQARSSDADLVVLFASVWAVPDASGRSLADLVEAVAETTSEVVTFEQKLLALGFSRRDSSAYTRRFSPGSSILFFRGTDIPRIRSFDPGISSIRYVIELDDADAIAASTITDYVNRLCGVFTAS